MKEKIKIADLFSGWGSTWYTAPDKLKEVADITLNDIRQGQNIEFYPKKVIHINANSNFNIFNGDWYANRVEYDLVYMDPPHLTGNETGLLKKKYTTLGPREDVAGKLTNMFTLAHDMLKDNGIAILKWSDSHIKFKTILDISMQWFVPLFGTQTSKTNYWCVLLKKRG